jgi:E3 ubiquitin-protein ligase RNF13
MPDLPADFGPDLPDEGVEGLLRMASPEDACLPFTFSDWTTPWIALISRQQPLHTTLNCTFDIKVCQAGSRCWQFAESSPLHAHV